MEAESSEPQAACSPMEEDKTDDNQNQVITQKELSECDREELHLIGNVQGNAGHTLFISYPEANIIGADAKIGEVRWVRQRGVAFKRRCNTDLGRAENTYAQEKPMGPQAAMNGMETGFAEELIGSSLRLWIPEDLYSEVMESIDSMKKAKSTRTFLFYEYEKDAFAISLSVSGKKFDTVCVEIEDVESTEAAGDFYNTLVSLGRVMEFYADEQVLKHACDTVFKLLEHYDRGMVYQFNDDNSGQVIHEIKKHHVTTSYKGMRFPASDIPLSARELYIKNGLRYIYNVDAEDVPIICAEGSGDMDLSNCRMRAVSKPHIVYLRNMGIVSSMSVAIVVEHELWGLLAFHGYKKAYKPSLHQRIACETINSMVSVKVESIMKKKQSSRVIDLSEGLMKWDTNSNVVSNLNNLGENMLQALDADILVAKVHDAAKEEAEIVVAGDDSLVPTEALWKHFSSMQPREVHSVDTREAIAAMGLSETDCPASGVAYYRDGLVQVMLGRGLRSKDVAWAGNPDEPKLRIGGILCPRNSFDMFMEKARKESRSWSTSDIHVFLAFMVRVCDHSHNRMMVTLKSRIEDANLKYYNAIGRAGENCEFFAQMSHELRTPFHGVMGCLNILHDTMTELSEEEVQDLVNTALSSGNHMINLLNDILSLSKNRHLSNAISDDRLSYKQLADEELKGLKSLAGSKKIEFKSEVTPADDNLFVVTDKTKFMQIVSNVVTNAIKYTPGGRVSVEYSLWESMTETVEKWAQEALPYSATVFVVEENEVFHSVDNVRRHFSKLANDKSDQKWMLTSVKDTGRGIKPKELAEMLQACTQSTRASNRAFQGTGLGLFICVTLCHHLNGFLAWSSTAGAGTAFHVGIPVKVEEGTAEDAAEIDGGATADNDDSIPIHGPIVVCDDNKVNVKILARGLELDLKNQKLDHIEILTADGGTKTVELYQQRRPSLLFVDYHMPDMNGDEATKRIRKYESEQGLQPAFIIIYTADLTDEATATLKAAGANEIMTKPPPKGFVASIVARLVVKQPGDQADSDSLGAR